MISGYLDLLWVKDGITGHFFWLMEVLVKVQSSSMRSSGIIRYEDAEKIFNLIYRDRDHENIRRTICNVIFVCCCMIYD